MAEVYCREYNSRIMNKKNLPIILLGIALVAVIALSCYKVPSKIFAWPEGVTALAVLFTLFFIAWQALLMRQSVSASDEVSKRELRAYLTVVIGDATFQERRDEAKGGDLKFECRPLSLAPHQQRARAELPNRVPCPLSAFILWRVALEIGFQVPHSLFIASRGTAEDGKLVESVNVALRGRSGVEVFGFRVFQFLHRSPDIE